MSEVQISKNKWPLWRKLCILGWMCVYTMGIWLAVWTQDQRVEKGILYGLQFLTFILAIIALFKPVKLVTLVIIAALTLAPYNSKADEPSGDDGKNVFIACLVLVVGSVAVYGFYKLCQKIPMPGEEPPPPPPPPCQLCNTNHQWIHHMIRPALMMPDRSMLITTNWQVMTLTFQSSVNGSDWQPEIYLTNWIGGNTIVSVATDARGNSLATNWNDIIWTNENVFIDLSGAWTPPSGDKMRLWRLVDLR